MDRKARFAKRPRTTRGVPSTKPQSGRGNGVSLQRIDVRNAVQSREHDFEPREVAEARDTLVELFDLLEEYSPRWYTEKHRGRALAAIRALQES